MGRLNKGVGLNEDGLGKRYDLGGREKEMIKINIYLKNPLLALNAAICLLRALTVLF